MNSGNTKLRRAALWALLAAIAVAGVVLAARCSPPSTISVPTDALPEINAAAAGMDAIAAWAPNSSPRLLRIDRTGADPGARVITARLSATGETIEIAVKSGDDGRWAATGPPQPIAMPTDRPPRSLSDRPPTNGGDAWIAASEFLSAYLAGDSIEARAWASSRYNPDPLGIQFSAVEITATDTPIEYVADRIAFVPIDYTTRAAGSEGVRRTWRTWVAVRENDGRWFVEGMFASEPVPPPEEPR